MKVKNEHVLSDDSLIAPIISKAQGFSNTESSARIEHKLIIVYAIEMMRWHELPYKSNIYLKINEIDTYLISLYPGIVKE